MARRRTAAGEGRAAIRAGAALGIGVGLLGVLPAETPRAQSLPEASAAALEHSWALRADRARQDGAEARLRGAIDSFMPSVAVIADKPLQSRFDYFPEIEPVRLGLDATPRRAPTQLGVTVEAPLFDGFRRFHNLQSAQALAESGRFLALSLRQKVLLETAAAYLAVLRDTRILRARESQIAAITRIREATERQYETNDATRTDVALTRSRVQEAGAGRDRALAELAASRLEFRRLVRQDPERMTPPRFPDDLPQDVETYAELVRQANPRLAAARLEARAAGYAAEAQAADFLPQINLQFAHVSQYGYSPALDRITDTTTRVTARVPLYEPGALPRQAEAAALARQRGYEVQDSELSTLTAARTAFARRKALTDQHARLSERVVQLRETMAGFAMERGAGFRTILDELNIRAELADAEVAAAIVLTERDAQSLQLAAAANRLEIGSGVPAAKRFEALPGPPPLAARKVPQAVAARLPEPPLRVSRIDFAQYRLR